MKNIYIVLLVTLFLSNCKEEDFKEFNPYASDPKLVKINNPVNDFVWKAMNSWYLWQDVVPDLNDDKPKNRKDYISYMNKFEDPKDLFNSLLYNKGVDDRFSGLIKDYDKHAERQSGVYTTFGFRSEKVLTSNGVQLMAIKLILENSPASEAKLKRGDFIIGINGRKFADGDYDQIIKDEYKQQTHGKFMIGEKDGKTLIKEISLIKDKVDTNAIQYSNIYKAGNLNIGYLVYNSFLTKNNNELNEVFAKFKNSPNQLDGLILDLRYNGGGSIATASYLGSLILGMAPAGAPFVKLRSNKKRNTLAGYKFTDKIEGKDKPTIQLNRLKTVGALYILTTGETASASEIIINCLRPYMYVQVIGTKTKGKPYASITLFDTPDPDPRFAYRRKPKGPVDGNHKYALQPLTNKIYNGNNESDYGSGFTPDILIDEFKYLDGLKALGDEQETLLEAALNAIKGISPRGASDKGPEIIEHEGLEEDPQGNNAYINPEDLENLEEFEGF